MGPQGHKLIPRDSFRDVAENSRNLTSVFRNLTLPFTGVNHFFGLQLSFNSFFFYSNSGSVHCHCGKQFDSIRKLSYHTKTAHEEPTHLCTYCGRKFPYATYLRRHILDAHERSKISFVKCTKCNKSFKGKRLLHNHIKQVHGELSWNCKSCNAAFTTKARLKKHTFSHLKKRPFNCHLCPSGYYMVQYLKGHYERSHDCTFTNEEVLKVCVRIRVDEELLKKIIVS